MIAGRVSTILVLLSTIGCLNNTTNSSSSSSENSCSNEVIYDWDPVYQETKKYTHEISEYSQACVKKNLKLTDYEQGLDRRKRQNITCTPQNIGKVWLKASDNFYTYRNDRVLLELDGTTGQFRRITLGITSDTHSRGAGKPAFSRDLGCFYLREDHETELHNPQDYGKQLLLDLGSIGASSETVAPLEIYRYEFSSPNWRMVRFDQNEDISGIFCPYLLTPWEFCTYLRNGNSMYLPDLTEAQNTSLTNETILIQSEFNFTEISSESFNQVWNESLKSAVETSTLAFKYAPRMVVDVPTYLWESWRDYVMGNRPYMPDTSSISIKTICYPATRKVVYSDGSTGYIAGQACYDGDGNYTIQ